MDRGILGIYYLNDNNYSSLHKIKILKVINYKKIDK